MSSARSKIDRRALIQRFAQGFVLALFLVHAAAAEASLDGAGKFVQSLADRAMLASRDGNPDRAKMVELIEEGIDIEGIGRFALGSFLRQANPKKVEEYLDVFREYVMMSYPDWMLKLKINSFTVTSSRVIDGQSALVVTQIMPNEGKPYDLTWSVREVSGKFKVQDVQYEGYSLRSFQRAKFEKILRDRWVDGLIRVLQSWVNAGREEPFF